MFSGCLAVKQVSQTRDTQEKIKQTKNYQFHTNAEHIDVTTLNRNLDMFSEFANVFNVFQLFFAWQ